MRFDLVSMDSLESRKLFSFSALIESAPVTDTTTPAETMPAHRGPGGHGHGPVAPPAGDDAVAPARPERPAPPTTGGEGEAPTRPERPEGERPEPGSRGEWNEILQDEAVQSAMADYHETVATWKSILKEDRQALREASAALQDEIAPLQEALNTAIADNATTLRADYKAIRAVYVSYREEMKAAVDAVRAAGDDADAKAAAETALAQVKADLAADLEPLQAKLKTDLAPVTAARQAITDLLANDDAYSSALAKLKEDMNAFKTAVALDREAIKSAIDAARARIEAEDDSTDDATDDTTDDTTSL